MGLEKSEVQLNTLHEVGVRMDDLLEGAKREVAECNGARTAAGMVVTRMSDRSKILDKEFQDGRMTEDAYRLAKQVWGDAIAMAQAVASSSAEQFFRCQGKVAALEATVKVAKTMHDTTKAKIDAVRQGMLVPEGEGLPGPAPGDAQVLPMRRAEGTHPGNPLAALRARGEASPGAPEASGAPSAPEPAQKASRASKKGGKRKGRVTVEMEGPEA